MYKFAYRMIASSFRPSILSLRKQGKTPGGAALDVSEKGGGELMSGLHKTARDFNPQPKLVRSKKVLTKLGGPLGGPHIGRRSSRGPHIRGAGNFSHQRELAADRRDCVAQSREGRGLREAARMTSKPSAPIAALERGYATM